MELPSYVWILGGALALALLLLSWRIAAVARARVIREEASAPPPAPAADAPLPPLPEIVPAAGPPDDLKLLKGVGPKLEAVLHELGVTRFEQIATWSEAELAAIDARLGAFQGRPLRDRWQEQARLLASGDRKAFEKLHGKLEPGA
jgi:predicted flap endonuclease-1-like 5' DNA nuclease